MDQPLALIMLADIEVALRHWQHSTITAPKIANSGQDGMILFYSGSDQPSLSQRFPGYDLDPNMVTRVGNTAAHGCSWKLL